MQTRRVLLLFALVLGLTALVGSLAPAPSDRDDDEEPAPVALDPAPGDASRARSVTFPVQANVKDVRVARGARLTVTVEVAEPADVELAGLGLRQTAEPLAPARFDLIARPSGRYAVRLHPFGADPRLAGRLVFARSGDVRQRRRRG